MTSKPAADQAPQSFTVCKGAGMPDREIADRYRTSFNVVPMPTIGMGRAQVALRQSTSGSWA